MDLMKNVFRVTLVVVCITLVVCIGTAVGDGRDEKVYHGQLALALLPVSAVTLMLAGAIAEGAGKENEALRQRIDAQQKAIQKLQYQVHHRD